MNVRRFKLTRFRKRTPNVSNLVYAESAKCPCGARLAYVPRSDAKAWDCSDILLARAIPAGEPDAKQHTALLPFAFYEIKAAR